MAKNKANTKALAIQTSTPDAPPAIQTSTPPAAPSPAPMLDTESKAIESLCKLAGMGWDGFGRQDVHAVYVAAGLTPEQATVATETLRAPYSRNGRALPKSQGEPIFRKLCESGEWRARCLSSLRGAVAGTLTAQVTTKPGAVNVK